MCKFFILFIYYIFIGIDSDAKYLSYHKEGDSEEIITHLKILNGLTLSFYIYIHKSQRYSMKMLCFICGHKSWQTGQGGQLYASTSLMEPRLSNSSSLSIGMVSMAIFSVAKLMKTCDDS